MTQKQQEALGLIEEQLKGVPEYSPVRMAGEQLKGIINIDPDAAELLAEDLRVKGKGIADAEKEIKKLADQREKIRRKEQGGNGASCVMPWEAEDILRKFYGLRERSWGPGKETAEPGDGGTDCHGLRPRNDRNEGKTPERGKLIDLADFL